ncbi:MAG TPA: YciI family protein [Prolixibacteraceae bacterium]|jgi:uncharacterized protein YciI
MNLFIISLFYKAPLTEVDKHLVGHNTFLTRNYENGTFICSGPKVPRSGGIIICKSDSYNSVSAIIEEDPFKIYNVADYEITEFRVADHAKGFNW